MYVISMINMFLDLISYVDDIQITCYFKLYPPAPLSTSHYEVCLVRIQSF